MPYLDLSSGNLVRNQDSLSSPNEVLKTVATVLYLVLTSAVPVL